MKIKRKITLTFIVLELIVYGCLLLVDSEWIAYIKYLGIVLAFIYTFVNYQDWSLKPTLYRLTFFFTLVADFFLLILNKYYYIGVSAFIVVQLLYFNIQNKEHKHLWKDLSIILRTVIFITVSLVLLNSQYSDMLNVFAAFYFINLVFNFIDALVLHKQKKESILLPLGFALFILCDICVGLYNFLPQGASLYNLVSFGMWFFYLPSQVLLSLSTQA